MLLVNGSFLATKRVVDTLESLGYILEPSSYNDGEAYDTLLIAPEHEGLFDYKKGSPATAGELKMKE